MDEQAKKLWLLLLTESSQARPYVAGGHEREVHHTGCGVEDANRTKQAAHCMDQGAGNVTRN